MLFVHTKTHRPAGRCFQMPGGALGPGFPPRALPLSKNPEEYRKITRYTKESRKIPNNPGKYRKIPKKIGGKFALSGSASETRAMIRKPTNTTAYRARFELGDEVGVYLDVGCVFEDMVFEEAGQFPPRALPLPKNPEEYRKITKYTEKSRKIPKNPGGNGENSPCRAVLPKPEQ